MLNSNITVETAIEVKANKKDKNNPEPTKEAVKRRKRVSGE